MLTFLIILYFHTFQASFLIPPAFPAKNMLKSYKLKHPPHPSKQTFKKILQKQTLKMQIHTMLKRAEASIRASIKYKIYFENQLILVI